MKIVETHKCEYCKANIEWEYIVPQNPRKAQPEVVDCNKTIPTMITKIAEEEYVIQLYCRKCGRLNKFSYHCQMRLA